MILNKNELIWRCPEKPNKTKRVFFIKKRPSKHPIRNPKKRKKGKKVKPDQNCDREMD